MTRHAAAGQVCCSGPAPDKINTNDEQLQVSSHQQGGTTGLLSSVALPVMVCHRLQPLRNVNRWSAALHLTNRLIRPEVAAGYNGGLICRADDGKRATQALLLMVRTFSRKLSRMATAPSLIRSASPVRLTTCGHDDGQPLLHHSGAEWQLPSRRQTRPAIRHHRHVKR